jgi:hypothetical protein
MYGVLQSVSCLPFPIAGDKLNKIVHLAIVSLLPILFHPVMRT